MAGEVAVLASDQVVLMGLALTNRGTQKLSIAEVVFSFEPFALAIRRNDSEFRLIADRTHARLNRTGQISPIYAKWFGKLSSKVPIMLEAIYVLNSTPD